MPAIPAVAQDHLVGLVSIRRLAAPDGEKPDHQTFVGHRVQVVELGFDLQIGALRVEAVDIRPARGLVYFPTRRGQDISGFHVGALAGKSVSLVHRAVDLVNMPDAVNPNLAERIPEHRAAVHQPARLRHGSPQ